MRVVILAVGVPPADNGGAEIAALRIAQCATKMGHDMHIIATGQCNNGLGHDGVAIHKASAVRKWGLGTVTCAPGVLRAIRRIKPDLVHVQSAYMTAPAILAKSIFKTPYLLYERGGVDVPMIGKSIAYSMAIGRADRVVAQTQAQAESLRAYNIKGKKIEVIPNGVDQRFARVSKPEARKMLGIPLNSRMVLAVGRCRPEKNYKDFVLASNLVTAKFVLIGDGTQLERLKELNDCNIGNGRVQFIGDVENSQVAVYMAAADVLVNTSSSEGFPLTILEAFSCGLPVVAPAVCGIPEIVKDRVNGLLSEPGNYVSTADCIRYVLEHPAEAMAMGRANKIKAREYTWENVVRRLYG